MKTIKIDLNKEEQELVLESLTILKKIHARRLDEINKGMLTNLTNGNIPNEVLEQLKIERDYTINSLDLIKRIKTIQYEKNK